MEHNPKYKDKNLQMFQESQHNEINKQKSLGSSRKLLEQSSKISLANNFTEGFLIFLTKIFITSCYKTRH